MKEKKGSDLLVALRQEKGLMAIELAKKLGVHRNTISFWERGAKIPSDSRIHQLAHFFEVDSDRLFFAWRKLPDDIEKTLVKRPAVWGEVRRLARG